MSNEYLRLSSRTAVDFLSPPIDGIGLDAQIITGELQWEIDDTAFNDMEIIHASSWYQNQMICVYDIYYHNTYIYIENG